ncbi:MAG: tyrosine-type recombinase/integrase, partial [Chloroflexi bacterium]|nr:tyrosine-type recombinase/integrase [Chloroflexota bacterium]
RERLLAAAGKRLIDARDRALVAVAYDGMLRRAELSALQVSDVVEEMGGDATLLVRRSKTDQEGTGEVAYLAPDTVGMVAEWLARAGIADGRLFRSLRLGRPPGEQLDASQIPRIVKRMARRAGLPDNVVDGLSGHSARVGAAQDMIASGIELPAILQAGRWRTTAMVNRYGDRLLARRSGAAQLARSQGRV